jgi:hypothetical protein
VYAYTKRIRSQIFHFLIHATPVAVSVGKCITVWTLQLAPTVDDGEAQDLFAASVPATAVILSFKYLPLAETVLPHAVHPKWPKKMKI